MKLKRLIGVVPIVLLTLTGCGEPQKRVNGEGETNNNKSERLHNDKSHGEYISPLPDTAPEYHVAVIFNSPYFFKNEFGNPIGYDVDLLRAIGEEAGFKVTFNNMEFSQVFTSLEKGTVDIVSSGIFLTPKRSEQYAASLPYSKSRVGYFTLAENNFKTKEEMDNKKISVIGGAVLTKLVKSTNAEVIERPTLFLAFQSIFTKESEATFATEVYSRYQAEQFKQFSDTSFKFIPYTDNFYTAMYAKKNNQALMDQINDGLIAIHNNGKYQEITKKWFGKNADLFGVNEIKPLEKEAKKNK